MAEKFLKLAVFAASYVLCSGCICLATEIVIDKEIVYEGQQKAGDPRLEKTVIIPKNVENINVAAYCGGDNIENVVFEEGSQLKLIRAGAFFQCSSLTSIVIPQLVECIETHAFYKCSKLATVTFEGERLERIGDHAFAGCNELVSVKLPPSVQVIEERAFADCKSLREIVIPASVTGLGYGIFGGSGLQYIKFESGALCRDANSVEKKVEFLESTIGNVSDSCVADLGNERFERRNGQWVKIAVVTENVKKWGAKIAGKVKPYYAQ
jgi:hypothetical protein